MNKKHTFKGLASVAIAAILISSVSPAFAQPINGFNIDALPTTAQGGIGMDRAMLEAILTRGEILRDGASEDFGPNFRSVDIRYDGKMYRFTRNQNGDLVEVARLEERVVTRQVERVVDGQIQRQQVTSTETVRGESLFKTDRFVPQVAQGDVAPVEYDPNNPLFRNVITQQSAPQTVTATEQAVVVDKVPVFLKPTPIPAVAPSVAQPVMVAKPLLGGYGLPVVLGGAAILGIGALILSNDGSSTTSTTGTTN